jgi:hypothetical protein
MRTREFLYIRNFHPERWPAGNPQMWKAVGPFGDSDGGPDKDVVLKGGQKDFSGWPAASFHRRNYTMFAEIPTT